MNMTTPAGNMCVKLSANEVKKFGKVVQDYAKSRNPELRAKIVDIFAPHIERKAAAAALNSGGRISAVDYAQNLYLNLLENLDNAVKKNKYVANALSKSLNEFKPQKDDLIRINCRNIDELNPKELMYCEDYLGNIPLLKYVRQLIDLKKDNLSKKQQFILGRYLNGMDYAAIGEECNISADAVKRSIRKAAKRLFSDEKKEFFEYLQTDRLPKRSLVIQADEPLFSDCKSTGKSVVEYIKNLRDMFITEPVVREFKPDEIWRIVQQNMPPVDVKKELSSMLQIQTNYGGVFSNLSLQTRVKKMLQINPDFVFKIKPEKRCNTPEFKKEVARISTEMFGKNIFEFI